MFCARVCGTPDRVCVLKAAREEKRRTVTHASEMAPSTHTYTTLTQTLVLSALTAALVRLLLRARHKVQGDEPLLVLSFGTLCLTARSLGVAGCRTFAAPFDWIFSNPAIVAHVIANDGRALLDPSEYIKAPTGGICHRTYSGMLKVGLNKQNRHSIIFNHHDPLERADDLAYFGRAVARLRAAMSSPLPKLCAICSLEKRLPLSDADLEVLLDALARHSNPRGSVTVVAVKLTTPPPNAPPPANAGLDQAVRHPERTRGHVTLRVIEMQCRGALGQRALSLADSSDARDLLLAFFGADAVFSSRGMLTRPLLAADPLSSGVDPRMTHAQGGMPAAVGSGLHGKYREDSYMVGQVGMIGSSSTA